MTKMLCRVMFVELRTLNVIIISLLSVECRVSNVELTSRLKISIVMAINQYLSDSALHYISNLILS